MSGKSGTSGQVISLPQGGGALHGIGEKFSPDLHTGTGNFTVPIALPPGRNGFQPQLNLVYSTGNGNGPFGLGWGLSIPGVSRKTSKGVPLYDDSKDTFILSGAEDLVPVEQPDGTIRYRPRTEGLFARIEHHRNANNDFWEVRSKDGLVSLYGTPRPGDVKDWRDPAAIAKPGRPDHVFAWKLTQTTDPFGNRIEYSYERDTTQVDGPHEWDQVYLSEIRYADYGDPDDPQFLVKVTFEYEDRPDPFSEYRAGFEIRTVRRCARIKVFTCAGAEDTLTRTYHLDYLDQEQGVPPEQLPRNGVSLLKQITVEGHDGTLSEKLPPLEVGYTCFEPEERRFFPVSGPEMPPLSLANPDYEMVDLMGNGLPDILEMNDTVRYWRNLGNGKLDRPREMKDAPAGLRPADPGVQMIDANGDGRMDLLVTTQNLSGYYPLRFGGLWDRRSFQRYEAAPSFNLKDPEVRLVDLDGDGVTDAIRSNGRLECFFNDPLRGWTADNERWVERRSMDEFPNVNFSDPRVKWADMTGDGLQDIVLVHQGNVEYWPSLGRGDWGKRVSMRNSPRLPYGYNPARILLGDVDGDGAADLVYVEDRKVMLWINQSGNGWSDAITIEGTPPVSDMDAVRLVDLLGNGISGLLWSANANGLSRKNMFFLDFTGGTKPYLLNEMDNHIGATTRIEYAPSTRFYLEDEKRSETRWKTPLPFPVQVVSCVEVIDAISGGKLTTEYGYHHGYWDGAEREFRGFGRVDQRDTEVFEDLNAQGLHPQDQTFNSVAALHFSPPTETRTWFHQGPVGDEFGEWEEADFSGEFWAGDPQLLSRPPSVTSFLNNLPRRVKRDALRTLRGSILRTELYAFDGSTRQDRPYTVTEHLYGVREESPPGPTEDERQRIFFPHALAERTTQWERGDEPMTQFTFTGLGGWQPASDSANQAADLDYDAYGQPRSLSSIAVPRGRDFRASVASGEPYLATQAITTYAQRDDEQRYIVDRASRTTTYEITNDGSQNVFALRDGILDGTATRTVIGQTLNFYDLDASKPDNGAFLGLPFGEIGDYGALVRTESLVLTQDILHEAYKSGSTVLAPPEEPPYLAPVGSPAWTAEYPQEFRDLLPALAGYIYQPGGAGSEYEKGYFAATERRRYDFHDNPVRGRGLVEVKRNPLGSDTTIAYDAPYGLLPTAVTDPAGLTTRADYDYRVLQPKRVSDANENWTEYFFTPLGLLKGIAVMGNQGEGDGIEVGLGFQDELDNGTISANLRQELESKGLTLSANATVQVKEAGNLWSIVDGSQYYAVRKTGDKLTVSGQPFNPSTRFEYNFNPFVLFEIGADFQGDLDNRTISNALRQEFENSGVTLSSDAAIRIEELGGVCLITDSNQTYAVRLRQDKLTVSSQPISVRTIKRVHHVSDTDIPLPERDETIESIEYSDGFGRLLQTRAQAEDITFGDPTFGDAGLPADPSLPIGDAVGQQRASTDPPCVVVSGWQVYDNKGRVVEKYEPFFSVGWDYVPPTDAQRGQKAIMYYDPRGHVVRTVNPDGSEQRVIYGVPADPGDPEHFKPTPWEAYTYDANDNAGRTHPAASTDYQYHWDTPSSIVVDALGRTVEAVERNRAKPLNPGDPLPPIEEYRTRSTYDIRGNLLTVEDALARTAFKHVYDLGNNQLRVESIDAGTRRAILDAAGNVLEGRDSKGALILHAYDKLNRPIRLWARDGTGQDLTLREHLIYGDDSPDSGLSDTQAQAANLLGKLYKHYDEAGLLTFESYDFKGNVLEKVRKVISDDQIRSVSGSATSTNPQVQAYRVDWEPPAGTSLDNHASTLLDATPYQTSMAYDALNRVKSMSYPEDVDGDRKELHPHYNRAGVLEKVELDGKPYVAQIAYNAKGQRTLVAYGNGVMTRYAYDKYTFRLNRLRSERYEDPPSSPNTWKGKGAAIQDFTYTYDLVGNISSIEDRTPGCGIAGSAEGRDRLIRRFEYDPLYRLTKADGRACANTTGVPFPVGERTCCGNYSAPYTGGAPTPNQDNAPDLTERYTETYQYDPAGNMLKLSYTAKSQSWTRMFGMGSLPPGQWQNALNNRLTSVEQGSATFTYQYDDNGNLLLQNTERHHTWDHADRMTTFSNRPPSAPHASVEAYYLYSADGMRVKKWVRTNGTGDGESTVYIDGLFEHYTNNDTGLTNNHLHVMDGKQRIALVRIGPAHPEDAGPPTQYHLGDHLGSSNLVLSEDGAWINREEYFPYGETSFGSFTKKRYRFTGKEQDEESGLYYHGARYYAPWLAKWTSCDPAGSVDGLNLFVYVANNPLRSIDSSGRQLEQQSEKRSVAKEVAPGLLVGLRELERPPTLQELGSLGQFLHQKYGSVGESVWHVVAANLMRDPVVGQGVMAGIMLGVLGERLPGAYKKGGWRRVYDLLDQSLNPLEQALESGDQAIEAFSQRNYFEGTRQAVHTTYDAAQTILFAFSMAKLIRLAITRVPPPFEVGEIKSVLSYDKGLAQLMNRESFLGNRALVTYNVKGNVADIRMQIFGPEDASGYRPILWEGDIGRVEKLPGTPRTTKFGDRMEPLVRKIVEDFMGTEYADKSPSARGPDLLPTASKPVPAPKPPAPVPVITPVSKKEQQ